jgi:hypothetical protein
VTLVLAGGLVLAAAGLGWVWRREQRRVGSTRGCLFEGCLELLDGATLARDGLNYPVLRGRWAGHAVELRPIADTLALRKLPSLWLQVTLTGATGAPGVLDALSRPLGVESWSPHGTLPLDLPTPPELPPTLRLRADGEDGAALLPVLLAQAAFLALPTTKEVLVTPKGVRLVVQLAEGERGAYLLFRDAQFAIRRLAAEEVAALLDRAADLHRAVRGCVHLRLDAAA